MVGIDACGVQTMKTLRVRSESNRKDGELL